MAAYITVGATTTHGGKVITGSPHTVHNGIPVSRKGDKILCKKCKKITTIVTGDPSFIVDGAPIARGGDMTSCGAKLIAVQHSFRESGFPIGQIDQPEPLQFPRSSNNTLSTSLKPDTLPSSPLSSTKILNRPATNREMYLHYLYGNGEDLTLKNLGAEDLMRAAIIKHGSFEREGSIESRFTAQIAKKFENGSSDYSFNNGYDFGSESLPWAFGSGNLSGEFKGQVTKLQSGDFHVVGQATYYFSDIFQDPYDTFDWFEGSWDPNGKPYNITGEIKNNINTVVTSEDISDI